MNCNWKMIVGATTLVAAQAALAQSRFTTPLRASGQGQLFAAYQATTPTPAPAPSAPPPPACAAAEHRQFDFWVGSWEVYYTGKPRQMARSLIERVYDGCGIRENWMPIGRSGGGSLNSYIPEAKEWRQLWIDNSNSWAEFRGGMQGKSMVISGVWRGMNGPGTQPLIRITYTPQDDGSVRQFGEQSDDGGKTWASAFDLTYRPAKTAAAPSSADKN